MSNRSSSGCDGSSSSCGDLHSSSLPRSTLSLLFSLSLLSLLLVAAVVVVAVVITAVAVTSSSAAVVVVVVVVKYNCQNSRFCYCSR